MIYAPILFLYILFFLRKGFWGAEGQSSVDCVGAWTNCSTTSHEILTCKLHFPQKPYQSTICHMRMACLVGGAIELYGDSPHTLAFDNEELPISPFATTVEKGSKWNVRFQVRTSFASKGNKFDPVPGVLIENVHNRNIGHVYGDEIWPSSRCSIGILLTSITSTFV